VSAPRDFEETALWMVRALMFGSATALVAGLLVHLLAGGSSGGAATMLRLGLTMLMSIPAVRVAVVIVDRLFKRDYQMVVMTAIVLFELAMVVFLAVKRV
jgi:uncharacterized membrane protein